MGLSLRRFQNSLLGFLGLVFLASPVSAAGLVDFNSKTHVTTKSRIWTEPSRYGEAIAALEPGLELEVIEANTAQSWIKVRTPSGREGWMPARHTALWGRRAEPLLPEDPTLSGQRNPASVATATAKVQDKPDSSQLRLGVSYVNQLNRNTAHGFGVDAGFEWELNPSLSAGVGLDYGFFGESAQSADKSYDTRRQTQRFVPQARISVSLEAFALTVGLGWELERTSFETTDLTTGDTLTTDPETGRLVTGAQWTQGLGFKLQPSFVFQSSDRSQFYVFASYALNKQLQSGDGEFLGTLTSSWTHMVGLGVGVRARF